MSSPNFRSHPCSSSKSVSPGPELPESFRATDSMASSVISTEMKIGISSYVSNVAQKGIVLLGCFPSKTDVKVLFIVPIQSSSNSSDFKIPPFSMSQTNRMALRNFSFRTRFEIFYDVAPQFDSHDIFEVSHRGFINVFHYIVKPSTIPQIKSKKMCFRIFAGF